MKITAKLNALNTLIENANRKIDGLKVKGGVENRRIKMEIITERDNYIREIKDILYQK